MRKFFCIVLLISITYCVKAQNLTVGTYNLRLETSSDVGNLWKDRRMAVSSLIRFHDFDILGIQEAFKNQIQDVLTALPNYAVYGKGRDDGQDAGEHSAIFYKKDKFELLDKGDFWLSETPETPSLGWDATCCKRICSWVYIKDKITKKKFYVFNAHYDHQGVIARKESSKLIISKIELIAGKNPAVFMGDLNGNHDSEPYEIIEKSDLLIDSYTQVKYPYANNNSFQNFGKSVTGTAIIDHVFVSKHFTTSNWGVLTDTYQGKYPSDHCPVLVKIALK
ncbi:endonuclease [Pedobacter psychrophilus]|uniref:Endonuclease n=1 Tax=Pedobacter psychrophilus TaxID=1826909 RepID=A0A179DE11_9SPHI|nr:endonuclease/exonuclease/phosphatase family protein [Pedobacter psychrophilus]OAQ39134.1 endonuclease [Pedobacter psychrophilus]